MGILDEQVSMAEMGTEPEFIIWRLTGFGILIFGSGLGSNFLTLPISGEQIFSTV